MSQQSLRKTATSADPRRALIDVAAGEFAAHGFEGASVQRIASAAGVSKAKVFYYFDGKEDLYSGVLERTLDPLLSQLDHVGPADSADAFWGSLDAGLDRAFAFAEGDPLAAALVRGLYQRQGDAPSFQRLLSRIRSAVDAWLRDGRRVGAVRTDLPVPVLAEAALGAMVHMERWLASNTDDSAAVERLVPRSALAGFVRDALQQRTPRECRAEVAYATEDVSRETDAYLDVTDVEVQPVTMRDGRQLSPAPRFDREGFELIDAPATFDLPPTDAEARAAYGAIANALKARTGALLARVFDHTVRHTERTPGQRPPIRIAHADYGRTAGTRRLRELLFNDQAEPWAGSRVVVANLWQSVAGVVHSMPLGFVDVASVRDDDFIPVTVHYGDRDGEVGYYRPSADHRWTWFPFLQPNEALLFKTFDGMPGKHHWSCPHAAFTAPNSPEEQAGQRTSIEFRILLAFPSSTGGAS